MIKRNAPPGGSLSLQGQAKPTRRILVVEDDPDIRRINAVALQRASYHVDTAKDGLAGWKVFQAIRHVSESYNLLITDHDMPGLTGLALVQKLRAADMTLPVIMATGKLPMEGLMSRYSWFQPAITLIKPYSIKELLETVEAILNTTDTARKLSTLPEPGPLAAIAFQL